MRPGALALLELSAKLVYLVLLLLDHLPVVVDQLPIRPVVDGDLGLNARGKPRAAGLQVSAPRSSAEDSYQRGAAVG